MTWFFGVGNRVGNGLKKGNRRSGFRSEKPQIIGILAFETAKTMSRLVSLYKSLSDEEINKLRRDVMRSAGVQYLNSSDEGFLLNLAFAEKIEDLDRIALAVARLGMRCQHPGLQRFERVYADLKLGWVELSGLGFSAKEIPRKIEKMEKFIAATADLYGSLEALTEMEVSERKLQQWKSYSGPIPVKKTNSELFEEKISWQRNHVRRARAVSLWSQSFDKIVSLMARAVCNVFARICIVFGPYISDLPPVNSDGNLLISPSRQLEYGRRRPLMIFASGPLERSTPKEMLSRNSGPLSKPKHRNRDRHPIATCDLGFSPAKKQAKVRNGKPNRITEAEPNTVGAAALALRYANVIIKAERLLNVPELVDAESREDLYQMLPASLRMALKERMRSCRSFGEVRDNSLAEGWREGLKEIFRWLAPMAHDMVRWQAERNVERQQFDSRPAVLLLQTLYYSDKEKTEAAIAEVLVGLSYVCRNENRAVR